MDSPTCDNDRLIVTSVNPWDDDLSRALAQFCNANAPNGPVESFWNMMQLQFITDSVLSGRGFWAKYRDIRYEAEISANESVSSKLEF
jgi:hypothetical protein